MKVTRHPATWVDNLAVALIGVPLLVIFAVALVWDGRQSIGILAALAVYVAAVLGLARLSRLPWADVRPTRTHYLNAFVAGALAGLVYALVVFGTLSLRHTVSGAIYAVSWWWVGSLIREPFGAKAWPPYSAAPNANPSKTDSDPQPGPESQRPD